VVFTSYGIVGALCNVAVGGCVWVCGSEWVGCLLGFVHL
jgi:hypothetical protein